MFAVGDKIIYGENGVCTIEKIAPISASEPNKLYYHLIPLVGSGVYFSPVSSPAFMRKLISRDEAEALADFFALTEHFNTNQLRGKNHFIVDILTVQLDNFAPHSLRSLHHLRLIVLYDFSSTTLEQRNNFLNIVVVLFTRDCTHTAPLALAYMKIEARTEFPVQNRL